MIAAYRQPDRAHGHELMQQLINSVAHAVPTALSEIITLGRTLKKRAADVLAYFNRPGTSNGPTEAINGRLEHLRGSALGFRNLTTTSPDPSWKPAGSDLDYTLDREEPHKIGKGFHGNVHVFDASSAGAAHDPTDRPQSVRSSSRTCRLCEQDKLLST